MRCLLLALCCVVSAACTTPPLGEERVVVISGGHHETGGKIGGLVVRRKGQVHVLDQPLAASRIDATGQLQAAQVTTEEVDTSFRTTRHALPGHPASFMLYFLDGRDELTASSSQDVAEIMADIKRRPLPDLWVMGHTDSVGSDEYNDRLSLARATHVRDLMVQAGIPFDRIRVAGRGKRERQVPIADNVAKPANRRVEVSVR